MSRVVAVAFVLALVIPAVVSARGEGTAACPIKDAESVTSVAFNGEGRLLCMHCNLHREESCRKVFQASNNEDELIAICPSSKVDLEAVSQEGQAVLRIAGRMVTSDDGTKMLVIESADAVGE